jgi:hypothetical protein
MHSRKTASGPGSIRSPKMVGVDAAHDTLSNCGLPMTAGKFCSYQVDNLQSQNDSLTA